MPKRRAAKPISTGREMLGEKLLHGGSLDRRTIEIADETGHVVDEVMLQRCAVPGRQVPQLFRRRHPVGAGEHAARIDKGVKRLARRDQPEKIVFARAGPVGDGRLGLAIGMGVIAADHGRGRWRAPLCWAAT